MNVCVFGLWHLGCVTAAGLASVGHTVVGLDPDESTLKNLKKGQPPIFEPGLADLIQEGQEQNRLSLEADYQKALSDIEVLWVTFDTPVDDEDRADTEFVISQIRQTFPHLKSGTRVLISSQLPVGTTASLSSEYQKEHPDRAVTFAYSPENLRLGKAIEVFMNQGRWVVGTADEDSKSTIEELLKPMGAPIVWMSATSAEMTKHAINAFLATSVALTNEIAQICEQTGADSREVERGLKSEPRIGPKAYVRAGGAFAGGTLARDVVFLGQLARENNLPSHLLKAVLTSNDHHKSWMKHKLAARFPDFKGKTIGLLGLTYKPGTDTLRRSTAVELAEWLASQGAQVRAFDPVIDSLPQELSSVIDLKSSMDAVVEGTDALVLATEWDAFKNLDPQKVVAGMKQPWALDPNRFLEESLGKNLNIEYSTVGKPA